uniref:Uncharacterized protein n=2 Tax=unclassified bacterial viruses TaxID=12333 RepID=A0AAU7J8B2_9VIRU
MPDPVPTAAELVRMGPKYAEATGWKKATKKDPAAPTSVRIHPAGHALMGEAMRCNALKAIADGAGDWHPEPPHRRSKGTS